MTQPSPRPRKMRLGRIALWVALVMALLVWGALQPPTRLSPLPWTGTLDI